MAGPKSASPPTPGADGVAPAEKRQRTNRSQEAGSSREAQPAPLPAADGVAVATAGSKRKRSAASTDLAEPVAAEEPELVEATESEAAPAEEQGQAGKGKARKTAHK